MIRNHCIVCFSALLATTAALSQQQNPFVIHRDVRLVEVYASVYDGKGHSLDGLTRQQFTIRDNGVAQKIIAFENSASAFSCGILLDTTGSMSRTLPRVKNAVVRLIDGLHEADAVGIYAFDTSVRTLQQFTNDKASAKRAVLRTRAGGETALFDAIAEVATDISTRPGKKALVLFTDGDDNASMLNMEAAVSRANKVGVPIFSVAQGEALRNGDLVHELRKISSVTGGLAYTVRDPREVQAVFHDISKDLQHTYMLAYTPPVDTTKDWHKISLSLNGLQQYRVRAREGYFPE